MKKTILLVEDDAVVRDMIKGALVREYRVLDASNCGEAVVCTRNPIDIALVDYDLPDGDGFDVLEAVKKIGPELPVIMMTAYSTDSLEIRALRAGVSDYLKKPLSLCCLLKKLSQALEGKVPSGPAYLAR